MSRRRIAVLTALTCAVAVTVPAAVPASATSTGSSYSAAAYGTAGTLNVTAGGTGLTGTLASLLTPLTSALNGLANSLASTLVTSITNAGLTATTPASTQSAPASGFPNCTTGGWNRQDCYSASSGNALGVPGVLSLGLNAAQGYAAADSTGYQAAAQVADPSLSLLGISIGDLGVAQSSATCPTTGSCSASVSLTNASLLGGLIKLKTATGSNLLQVQLGTNPWIPLSSLGTSLTAVGTGISAKADGTFLQINISISLTQLLSGLGLGGLLSSLAGLDLTGTSLTLSVLVGPGSSTSNGATAWGLDVGLDLSGSINISATSLLSGLLGSASITIPSGITGSPTALGNLASLELAYTAVTAGSAVSSAPVWFPPGLI